MNSDGSDRVTVGRDPDTGEYVATFDPEVVAPSVAVVEATGPIRDADESRYDPLFGVVDLGALDRICGDGGGEGTTIAFTYRDHRVRVRGDGRIEVAPVEPDGPDGSNA